MALREIADLGPLPVGNAVGHELANSPLGVEDTERPVTGVEKLTGGVHHLP